MAIIVREAELPRDREVLLSVLLRNRDPGHNSVRQARFQWSYFTNPYGQPRAWLAIDSISDKVVGAAGAFPRRLFVQGEPVVCWNGGDSSIDREFRTLGPAIKLREAMKSCVERGEMTFLYSYPVDAMRVVLERIGHFAVGKLPRHRLPLTADRFVERFVGRHLGSAIIAQTINGLMLLWRGNFVRGKPFEVRAQRDRRFGAEYDKLFDRIKSNHSVVAARDSQFLTWRFLQNPVYQGLRIIRLEGPNGLHGYAVLEVKNGTAQIVDLLVDDINERKTLILLSGVIRMLRRDRVHTLSVRASTLNPIVGCLRACGVVAADFTNSSVCAYASPSSGLQSTLDEANWFMTEADRDV